MANPILDKLEEVVKLNEDLKTINDQRFDKMEKGQDVRSEELDQQVDKINVALTKAVKERDTMIKTNQVIQDRVEMLEALSDRPKGTPKEQIEDEYKAAFFEGLCTRFQDQEVLAKMQGIARKAHEYKDIVIGTDASGGFALPKIIAAEVDKLILQFSDIASNVKNVQVGSSDYQELLSIHGGTSGWVGEAGSRSATGTPGLRNCKPTWGELYAYPQVSEWSLQDLMFNVEQWLTNDIAEGMAVTLSTAIHAGTGSDQPTGMTNTLPVITDDYASPMRAATAYEIILATNSPATTLNGDDFINLAYKLRAGYRQGAKFAMNSTTQGLARKLKDSNGQYLWQPSLQLGQPDRLVGYESFTWEDMDDVGSSSPARIPVAFGNWNRAYTLTHRSELMITPDNITNPGYVRFYVRRRWGGIPKNNDAVKFLQNA